MKSLRLALAAAAIAITGLAGAVDRFCRERVVGAKSVRPHLPAVIARRGLSQTTRKERPVTGPGPFA